MRVAGLLENDVVNGEGVCVSLFVQGCPHHCTGCFNSQTWDFNGGYIDNELRGKIVKAISANGIKRNFSILGGEPLCPENRSAVKDIIMAVRSAYPNIKIFCWTGYYYEDLIKENDDDLKIIFKNIDTLIDGPYECTNKSFILPLRGSSNQRIIELKET